MISVNALDDQGQEYLKTNDDGLTTDTGVSPIKMWFAFDVDSVFFETEDPTKLPPIMHID